MYWDLDEERWAELGETKYVEPSLNVDVLGPGLHRSIPTWLALRSPALQYYMLLLSHLLSFVLLPNLFSVYLLPQFLRIQMVAMFL